MKVFDVIYTLTGGGPGTVTEAVIPYIYRTTFWSMDMGYSSALSLLFLIGMAFLSLLIVRAVGRIEET
jgi:ABC-type sugar transport system permease subunit